MPAGQATAHFFRILYIIIFVFSFINGAYADSDNSVKIAKDNEMEYGQIKERDKNHYGRQ